jgi:pimeloyl-ACP methyl ester carboxylesterase
MRAPNGGSKRIVNGTWNLIEINGKPADVYDPPGRPRFGLIYLHSYGLESLRGRSAYTTLFDDLRLACVCPSGGHSWWGNRVCAEFDAALTPERYLLDFVLPFLRERWGLDARGVGLFGVSMGGQGALRLGFRHPDTFAVVAGIASAIEYHELYGDGTPLDDMYESKEQCRQDTAPMHVDPGHPPAHLFFCADPDDEWWRGNDRLHEKLGALGVPHEVDLTTRAGGHSWAYFDHVAERVLRFLDAGLDHQSRRLL